MFSQILQPNPPLTSTSVAVSESPLSLPSGRSCSSAEMHIGSSTEFFDIDFCDGMLRRDFRLTPECERGNWAPPPPAPPAPPLPPAAAAALPAPADVPPAVAAAAASDDELPAEPAPSEESSTSQCDLRGRICASFRHLRIRNPTARM